MYLGKIVGKTSTMDFRFKLDEKAEKFQYIQFTQNNTPVLAQIIEIEKDPEKTIAICQTLGYRDQNTRLQILKTPPEPNTEIFNADDSTIREILGLNDKKAGAYIGKLINYPNIKVYLNLNNLLTKHLAVLAKSGSGKSFATAVLIEELLDKKIPVVIIDPHGEYSSLKHAAENSTELERFDIKPKSYAQEIKEYSPDVTTNPEAEPLKLSNQNMTSKELLHLLPTKLSNNQKGTLYASLKNIQNLTFDNIISELEILDDSYSRYTIIHVIEYLKKLNIFSENSTPLSELVQQNRCSIINLKGISSELQEVIVYKIAKDLFQARKTNNIPPFFLVIEEAHNYCLTKDSKITTNSGDKFIGELSKDDLITTINQKTGSIELNNINFFHKPIKKEVYKIITEFGNNIKTTKDHPFYTKEGFTSAIGLKHVSIPVRSNYKMVKNLVIARLIGHILGDGWLENSKNVGFSGQKEDLLKIKIDLDFLGFKSSNLYKKDKISYINSIESGLIKVDGEGYFFRSSNKCFNFFKKMGLPVGRKVLQPFSLPKFILNSTLDIKAEFLSALMGSDGYKLRIKNKNPDVIRLSFSKIEDLKGNGKKYSQQLINLFNQFDVKASYWIRKGNLRKDGLKTLKFIIDISNKNQNLYNFLFKIGFKYQSEREELAKKVLYYYKHKLNIINRNELLRKKVISFRNKTGFGKTRLSKKFGITEARIKHWIYDFKDSNRSKLAGLGRLSFLSFKDWNKKYTDKYFIYDPVKEIKKLGIEEVYNISTNNLNFIANNMLVHNCPERSFGESKSSPILRQLCAEGRKFGLGTCFITQRPSRIEKNILSQITTQIILKITNPHDYKAVSSSVEGITSEIEKEIRNIPIGTAIITGLLDLPIFVEIRPRKTKHGGTAVKIFEDRNFDGELLPVIKPTKTIKQLKDDNPDKDFKAKLMPCVKLTCSSNGNEFNLLLNLFNAEVVTDLNTGSGIKLKSNSNGAKLSSAQERVLQIAMQLKEFVPADLFSRSGLQFSELYDIVKTLETRGYFTKNGQKYLVHQSLSQDFNKYKTTCQINYETFKYDEKLQQQYLKKELLDYLAQFLQITNQCDCYLITYN